MAVVVVIGLVVVSLSVGFFDSAGDISTTTRDISRVTSSGIVVTEGVVDSDGNIVLNLRNQTGQVLTLTGVDAEGTSSNYENRLTTNQEILLKAFSENCKCTPGQTTTTCEIQLTYDTQIPNRTDPKILIELECIEQISTTTPPVTPLFAGLCGEAINQEPFYETPENDLCEIGNPGTITYNIEDGNWEWACIGSTQTLTDNCSVSRDVGDGSEEKPKILFTCQDLQDMNQDLSAHYILGQNINCSGFNFKPVGYITLELEDYPFKGSLDGNGHLITNLTISNLINNSAAGLFGLIDGGNISNLGVVNSQIEGDIAVGGIAGVLYGGSINNVFSTGNVSGNINVGGLVGISYATINNSYSMANVLRKGGNNNNFGGLVGKNKQGKILNSYSTGRVEWQSPPNPTNKGFVGYVDAQGNYEMSGNFFDMDSSEQNSTAGEAEGKTTSQMTWTYDGENTFENAGWDFEEIWSHDIDGTINNGYPYLRWQTE